MSHYPTDWIEAGACQSADPELFFPVALGEAGERQAAQAQRICETCRVRRECLEFAMDNAQAHGIWGGTTPEDRIRLRRRAGARRHRRGGELKAAVAGQSRVA